jgi:hypothetical protein
MTITVLKRSLVTAIVLTALAACVSEMPRFPLEPGPTVFQPSFTQVKASDAGRTKSNRIKYRDSGLKPGRVTGGLIEVQALRGRDGMTTLEATTGSFDEGPALARIEKMQVRILNTDFPALNDRPQSRTWSRTMANLAIGDLVEFTAHVRYTSGTAPRIITIVHPVARRPDLAVTQLAAPERAQVNAPVTLIATIVEKNGQVGARANCLLSVNDIAVDQASRIWVDANGVVSCEFTHIFRAVGPHDVAVSLTNITPRDDDPDNDVARASIEIMPRGQLIASGSIQANDQAYTTTYESVRTGAYPINGSIAGSNMVSSVLFSGGAETAAQIQQITARLSADGREISSSTLTELSSFEFDDGLSLTKCVQFRQNGESARSCVSTSHFDGSSTQSFSYSHSSGQVTYFGQTVYCYTEGCFTWEDNLNSVTGTGQRYGIELGSQLRVELAFTDITGLDHVVDRIVTFQDESAPVNYDRYACGPYGDGLGDICIRETSQGTSWRGVIVWPEMVP